MRQIGVLLVRRSVPNMAVDNNQGWPVVGREEILECLRQRTHVVGVGNAGYVPTIALEAGAHIFTK